MPPRKVGLTSYFIRIYLQARKEGLTSNYVNHPPLCLWAFYKKTPVIQIRC